jgi:hypothetical protein
MCDVSQKIVQVPYASLGLFPTYCFAMDRPILRFSTYGSGIGTLFNQLVLFQGRYFARQISIKDKSLPRISIQIDEVGALGTVEDAMFILRLMLRRRTIRRWKLLP